MQNQLGARATPVELGEAVEPCRILAEEAHDLARRENAPVVRLRVVAERGKPLPGFAMVDGRRVEVDASVREVVLVYDVLDRVARATRVRA